MKSSYGNIGKVFAEKIGDEYYQYTTGPVQVLSATHKGTVGSYSLIPVSPMDLIIKRKDENIEDTLKCLPKSHSMFKAMLCYAMR